MQTITYWYLFFTWSEIYGPSRMCRMKNSERAYVRDIFFFQEKLNEVIRNVLIGNVELKWCINKLFDSLWLQSVDRFFKFNYDAVRRHLLIGRMGGPYNTTHMNEGQSVSYLSLNGFITNIL